MAIRNFKYANRSDLADPLARAVWSEAKSLLSASAVFVPVPLHPKRLCERGYNQAALLAHRLARLASNAVDVSTLRRVDNTAQQARLKREDRERNLQHTMQATRWCNSRPVVLVDDVFTTGATLLECERALNEAGARVVAACVIAIAGREPDGTARDAMPDTAVQPEPILGIL
jgi:ComF family protein